MTRFLNGPVVAMFLAAACALTAYVLVTGAQTRRSATLTERGPAALDAQGLAAARLTDAVSTTGLPPLPGADDGRRPERRRSQRRSPRSLNVATLTERAVFGHSRPRASATGGILPNGNVGDAARSVNVAYHHRSYPVDFRHRWILEKAHRLRTNTKLKAEHAYAQRLLRELRHARTVQAHVETRPSHYDAWMCIHSHEGAWDANTGNGYYGGLQMDKQFQRNYAPDLLATKGTADRWEPLEQMLAAERAFSGYNGIKARGYSPWPNTARMCGLL